MRVACLLVLAIVAVSAGRPSEVVKNPNTVQNDYFSPLPHTYVTELPKEFSWHNVNGTSFLTKSLNQHIPQYCGSCWAHGALSALADRIKIARNGQGADINLAIQFILNCGDAGSCHGGDHLATYEFIKKRGYVPYDTCLQYQACSSESDEGLCGKGDYSCKPINTCRTCSTFSAYGGFCSEIDYFPNATVSEYGAIRGADKMAAEILKRGPIACGVDASAILEYQGGVIDNTRNKDVDHVISIVGWGHDEDLGKDYWIIRNSWGEYWGNLGYFRLKMGDNQLGMESNACSWAVPLLPNLPPEPYPNKN